MNKRIFAPLVFAIFAISAIPVHAAQVLAAETQLATGQYLVTSSGLFSVIVQSDGNVVMYFNTPLHGTRPSQFATNTNNGHHLRMQMDGNLALYTSSNTWAWTSGSGGHPYNMGYKLVLFETGKLQIQDANNNLVVQLQDIDRGSGLGGPAARFPFRTTVNGICTNGLTAELQGGSAAQSWAIANGGTVGYCNSIY